MERMNDQLRYLLNELAQDPLWQQRREAPEPLRRELARIEQGVGRLKNILHNDDQTGIEFQEGIAHIRELQALGHLPTIEQEEIYTEVVTTTNELLAAFPELRSSLIAMIDMVRKERGASPLPANFGTSN